MPRLELEYVVVDAFASETFRGNPAAVVFLDEHSSAVLKDEQRKVLAQEFNQPVTAFITQFQTSVVSASVSGETTLGPFGIQWITPSGEELRLCGHGTLAASHALFDKFLPTDDAERGTVKLQTKHSGELVVRRDSDEGGRVQIRMTLPAGDLQPAPEDLEARVKQAVGEAIPALPAAADGRSVVKAVRVGVGLTYGTYVLVEVDDSVDIASMQVDSKALLQLAPFHNVSITNAGGEQLKASGVSFVSRVFIPLVGIDEDHVCGSAHCLLVPYWAGKLNAQGKNLQVKQVSARGGDLEVEWVEGGSLVKLSGPAVTVKKAQRSCQSRRRSRRRLDIGLKTIAIAFPHCPLQQETKSHESYSAYC
ncbi:phenazine biosynthesis protein [Auriculariales sp. MPI-PUGE-AT-0066]|nr:phenazine biosynthesis protein [Auriculariales sp. MPI-PUGE-AT-0066]